MEHVTRTESAPQTATSAVSPRLISRFEIVLKGGLLIVALGLLGGFVPVGAATTSAPFSEVDSAADAAVIPASSPAHHPDAGDRDEAPLLIFALVGFALLALSRVPSNPKHKRPEGDLRSGKNDVRGQDLPVDDAAGAQLATR